MTPPDLERLADRLTAGAPLAPEERQWLAASLRRFAPQRSPASARGQRDRLLRALYRASYASHRPRPAAEAMAADLARYQATAWRHDRHRPCPYEPSTAQALFWAILSTGQPALRWRAIFDLICAEKVGATAQNAVHTNVMTDVLAKP